jgi:hypothetical protein
MASHTGFNKVSWNDHSVNGMAWLEQGDVPVVPLKPSGQWIG